MKKDTTSAENSSRGHFEIVLFLWSVFVESSPSVFAPASVFFRARHVPPRFVSAPIRELAPSLSLSLGSSLSGFLQNGPKSRKKRKENANDETEGMESGRRRRRRKRLSLVCGAKRLGWRQEKLRGNCLRKRKKRRS